ncbi:MAG: DUF6273 domain-containing protein [Christensenellaceae bacterium]|jgi:tetratricopeptide (TPR) repeat protein|nr:DUF6273 domain-containing protein [Christensenellaceae bacterium]
MGLFKDNLKKKDDNEHQASESSATSGADVDHHDNQGLTALHLWVKATVTVLVCLAVLAGLGAGYWFVGRPMLAYNGADKLEKSGQYAKAAEVFNELGDYAPLFGGKSSYDRANAAIYKYAESLMENEDYEGAIKQFKSIRSYEDAKERIDECSAFVLNIGDTYTFGGYEWVVLDKQEGKALIITKDIIDLRAYNEEYTDVTWEQSTLRAWLNGEFYNRFGAAERSLIANTKVVNDDNPWEGTDGGNDTTDKIFLLSLDEFALYFGDSGELASSDGSFFDDQYKEARIANLNVTQAQIEDAARRIDTNPVYGNLYTYEEALDIVPKINGESWHWWLRSPGYISYYAATVFIDGFVVVYGSGVSLHGFGVRPALWLNL